MSPFYVGGKIIKVRRVGAIELRVLDNFPMSALQDLEVAELRIQPIERPA